MKNWVVLFDENGRSRCGSDWNMAFNVLPSTIRKRLAAGYYTTPKDAAGYVILSDYQFKAMTWEQIDAYYKMNGRQL